MKTLAADLLTPDEARRLEDAVGDVGASFQALRRSLDMWLEAKGISRSDRELMQDALTDRVLTDSRLR